MDRIRRHMLLGFAAPAWLGACAGFRGGWDSVAYVGDTPPATPRRDDPIELPGLSLRVSINNRLRTRDTQVVLYALPVSIDPRGVYSEAQDANRTRVYLDAKPSSAGWMFRPQAAVLSFGGKSFAAERGQVFGQWDADGNRVERGGRYEHKRVDSVLALDTRDRRYLLSVDFATPVPHPQALDIALDVSSALRAEGLPTLPRVRFVPARWEEGYT
jgi:hypothetical protein